MIATIKWQIAQKAELSWWKSYLRKKPRGLYLDWKTTYWHTLMHKIRDLVEQPEGKSILDMGCGPAGIYMILENNQVTAVDPLITHYESELAHFSKNAYPYVTFVNESVESFQHPSSFDLIFCLNAINHVQHLQRGLTKLKDLLAPGGKLILSIDVHNFHVLKHLFRFIPFDVLHPHQHNLEEYQKMISDLGMKVVHSEQLKSRHIFDYWLMVVEEK